MLALFLPAWVLPDPVGLELQTVVRQRVGLLEEQPMLLTAEPSLQPLSCKTGFLMGSSPNQHNCLAIELWRPSCPPPGPSIIGVQLHPMFYVVSESQLRSSLLWHTLC